jgi:sugar lactone lactonase YvrE
VLLLLDDGLSGLVAVDPDSRLYEKSAVAGQRAGDEPYSMIRVVDKLVVGWANIMAVDVASREPLSLGQATIFVPAAEPDRVWLVNYPGGRIGAGEPSVWQVNVESGEALSEPKPLDVDGFPVVGIKGGVAIQTDTGMTLWDFETGQTSVLDGNGPGFPFDTNGEELVWCGGECRTLVITNTSTLGSEEFQPPEGHSAFIHHQGAFQSTDYVSPSGRYFAALVGQVGDPKGRAIWILDRDTGATTLVADPNSRVDYLGWSPDGDQLFATSWSYGETVTAVWRYQVDDDDFRAVVLPFGGALSLVVVDTSVADAYFSDDAMPIAR